jgi:uncharacterized protein (DUF697 family)
MTKKLPKAILWTADDMQETASSADIAREPHPVDFNEPQGRSTGPRPGPKENIVEMSPRPQRPAAAAAPAPLSAVADTDAQQRKFRANAIVERHANYSAIGGLIPVPIANIAGITAIIVRMVKSLSELYGVPFERNRARAIVIGLMGGVMPTGLATAAVSTLIYLVPGHNLVGLAVSSVTASACARSIGQLFIEHFENGSTLVDFPAAILR